MASTLQAEPARGRPRSPRLSSASYTSDCAGQPQSSGPSFSGAGSKGSSGPCTPAASDWGGLEGLGAATGQHLAALHAHAAACVPAQACGQHTLPPSYSMERQSSIASSILSGATDQRLSMGGSARPSNTGSVCSGSAASLQPKLLKQINSFSSKEDLLAYVASCLSLLDDINLVTCIYRLARMYSGVKNLACRMVWGSELLADATFVSLLRTLQSHVLQAHLQLMHSGQIKGFDARCISNLVWAIVKLEIPMEQSDLGFELVQGVTPLVVYFLQSSSSQGLANLLWAFSKMPVPLLHVIMLIVEEMSTRLDSEVAEFDAQALSNSIWALAHVRSKVADLDEVVGGPSVSVRFMLGIANCTLAMLRTLQTRGDMHNMQHSMMDAERHFSCQALVNICWSFASMLGDDCNKIPAIQSVFVCVRAEALVRLRATATALQLNQPWILRLSGGFNEQALSNIVYAFDKAQLLDRELLQLVYTVAMHRLERCHGPQLAFKPQELCTLLRAAHLNVAQPWAFLDRLQRLVAASPRIVQAWTGQECAELERGLALLDMYRLTVVLQQHGQQQQQQSQQQQHQQALAAMQYSNAMQQQHLLQQPPPPPGLGPIGPKSLGNGQMSLSQFQHLMAAQQQQQQAFAVPVHHGNGVPPMNHTNGGMPAAPLRMLDLPEFR